MNKITNSLTDFLDSQLPTIELIEEFIDNLEDQVFDMSNRDFYLKYKGDIKELLAAQENYGDQLNFEYELLSALNIYCNQRQNHQ